VLKLPEVLGGETHILCIAGSYTFTAASARLRAAGTA
jgi:hypothetical protein